MTHATRPRAATGRLEAIHRWPVKSFRGGDGLDASVVTERGLAGDRAHAVVDLRDPRERPLSARRAPRLLAWSARYDVATVDAEDPPAPEIISPGGSHFSWSDPALASVLSEDLGRPIDLRSTPRGMPDRRGTVLVTLEATRAAIEAELGRPLDLRRFRTNLHLALDAPPFAEEAWAGRRISIGPEVVLRVEDPCERCAIPTRDADTGERWPGLLRWLFAEHRGLFGLIVRVERAGSTATGAEVRVEG